MICLKRGIIMDVNFEIDSPLKLKYASERKIYTNENQD